MGTHGCDPAFVEQPVKDATRSRGTPNRGGAVGGRSRADLVRRAARSVACGPTSETDPLPGNEIPAADLPRAPRNISGVSCRTRLVLLRRRPGQRERWPGLTPN